MTSYYLFTKHHLTLFRNCLSRFSLFSAPALNLCLPIEAIKYASCSSKQARAAFLSGPLIDSLIFSVSSFFHSILDKRTTSMNNTHSMYNIIIELNSSKFFINVNLNFIKLITLAFIDFSSLLNFDVQITVPINLLKKADLSLSLCKLYTVILS